ncbi:MAG: VWA domain-containing protein [Phycisphaerales bacterium]|nr:VWA domain-containing protein [Phycisphaerales bacterium]
MWMLATVVESQQRTFELAGLPTGWMRLLSLLVFAGLLYLVFWLYRREARIGAGAGLRIFMAALRCTALMLLAGIWLQPTISTYLVRTVHGRVAVLVDSSASMSIVDGDERDAGGQPESREQRVASFLAGEDHRWLRALAQRNEPALYAFGERTARTRLPFDTAFAATSAPSARPDPAPREDSLPAAFRNRTDLGQAIAAAVDDGAGTPLAAIVVFTDGGMNKGMTVDAVAALARRAKARVYAVGVGAMSDPMNVRVASVTAPATTPLNDPFELRAEVVAAGIEPTSLQLEIVAEPLAPGRSGASEHVVESRSVLVGGDKPSVVELFRITPAQAGEFTYRARVAPVPGEPLEADNQRETTVLVTDEKLRVLLIAGRPSNDYRLVTGLLTRDKTVDLSCWLQTADERAVRDGDTTLTELPRKPEEIFSYDAVILMDPSPTDLDSAWAIHVRRLVDEFGGGLLFQAGTHFSSRFLRDPRMQDLVAILPITPDVDADVRLSEEGPYRPAPIMSEIPPESTGHPLIALNSDPTTNRDIWSSLPPPYWYLPVQREKPIASLLLRGTGERVRGGAAPLVAAQPFGAGRVAFMAFDGTWRWRATGESYFNRFWVQAVRYLSQARREGSSRRGTIVIERDVVNVGESVNIEARALDATFSPVGEPRLDATLESADGSEATIPLLPIIGRDGWYSGRATAVAEGAATVRVPLPGAIAVDSAMTRRLRVVRPELEMQTTRLQSDTLSRIAEASGGRVVALRDAATLATEIPSGSVVKPPIRIGDEALWDRGWLLALIAGLLSLEWTLRRRNQLL